MEIGVAGPIAGFIVAVPTLIIGLFLSEIVAPTGERGFSFGSSSYHDSYSQKQFLE